MKKILACLCIVTLLIGTVSVYGESSTAGDKDGDICTNPWGERFTTVTETEQITTDETTTKLVELPNKPEGLTYAGNDNLPYYFAWGRVNNADSYNVYVNNILVDNVVNSSCNINATYFEELGEYTIGVSSVNTSGESEKATIQFDVVGPTIETSSIVITTSETQSTSVVTTTVTPTEKPTVPATIEITTIESTSAIVPTIVEPTTSKKITTTAKVTTKMPTTKIVAPSKVKITKAKIGKEKVSLKLKKIKGVKGYKIQYSTNKKFKKAKVKYTSSINVTIKRLKSKKKYYIRVKAYKLNNKKRIYSTKWSNVKKVKVK